MNENTQHPLTETAAAKMWDTVAPEFNTITTSQAGRPQLVKCIEAALRAAFDAGREHEREHAPQDRPAEVTTEAIRREVEYVVRTAAAHGYSKGKWGGDRSEPIQALIKSASAALTAALAVATPADPHHDPRPWQDCTREDIREGALVETRTDDRLYVGVAHHQDEDGDWLTKEGWLLTNGTGWPLRRIPTPTPEKDTPMTETPATADPLARIRAQADAATEGPWTWATHSTADGDEWAVFSPADWAIATNRDGWGYDAEFIAAARTNVPRLVDALEAVLKLHVRAECPTCGSRDGEGNEFHRCDDDAYCEECDLEGYPCPTVTAVTIALEGESHA